MAKRVGSDNFLAFIPHDAQWDNVSDPAISW